MSYNAILLGLKTLAGHCDGARQLDGQGFSRFDAEIGHSLASKSELSDKQAKIGQTLIIKYGGQLDPDLVSKVKSLEIIIHTPSIETALNTLNWSSPKVVKGGTLQLETANPTQAFWAVWKADKESLKNQGFSVTNDKGNWKVNKWTKIGVSAVATNPPLNNETVAPVVSSNPVIPVNIPEETRVKLLPHQPASVEKLVNSIKEYGAALDASDCGVGKTFISLACAKTLGMKALVICPKPAIPGWQRAAEYMGVEADVINYEMVKTGNTEWGTWVSSIVENSKGEKKKVETFEWTTLYETLMIWDECHKLKNRDTISSQIAIGARLQGNKMLLLSATAASNPLEMKALGFILNLFPLKGYWNWAERHGVRKGRFGMEFTGGAYHLQNIHKSIFQCSPLVRGVRLKREFSAQRILQAIGRTHRAKTVSKSIQRFCYAAGTIEERARQRVMEKARNISLLTDGDLTCGLVI